MFALLHFTVHFTTQKPSSLIVNKTLVSKQSWALKWNMSSCLCGILVDVLPVFVIRIQKQRKALQHLLQATCSRTSKVWVTKAPQLCVYLTMCFCTLVAIFFREPDEMQMMKLFTFFFLLCNHSYVFGHMQRHQRRWHGWKFWVTRDEAAWKQCE